MQIGARVRAGQPLARIASPESRGAAERVSQVARDSRLARTRAERR